MNMLVSKGFNEKGSQVALAATAVAQWTHALTTDEALRAAWLQTFEQGLPVTKHYTYMKGVNAEGRFPLTLAAMERDWEWRFTELPEFMCGDFHELVEVIKAEDDLECRAFGKAWASWEEMMLRDSYVPNQLRMAAYQVVDMACAGGMLNIMASRTWLKSYERMDSLSRHCAIDSALPRIIKKDDAFSRVILDQAALYLSAPENEVGYRQQLAVKVVQYAPGGYTAKGVAQDFLGRHGYLGGKKYRL